MITISVTNKVNGKSDSIAFDNEAQASAAIMILNTEYDSSTFDIKVDRRELCLYHQYEAKVERGETLTEQESRYLFGCTCTQEASDEAMAYMEVYTR